MPTNVLVETMSSKTRHGVVILTGSDDAAQPASAPAEEVVAR